MDLGRPDGSVNPTLTVAAARRLWNKYNSDFKPVVQQTLERVNRSATSCQDWDHTGSCDDVDPIGAQCGGLSQRFVWMPPTRPRTDIPLTIRRPMPVDESAVMGWLGDGWCDGDGVVGGWVVRWVFGRRMPNGQPTKGM